MWRAVGFGAAAAEFYDAAAGFQAAHPELHGDGGPAGSAAAHSGSGAQRALGRRCCVACQAPQACSLCDTRPTDAQP